MNTPNYVVKKNFEESSGNDSRLFFKKKNLTVCFKMTNLVVEDVEEDKHVRNFKKVLVCSDTHNMHDMWDIGSIFPDDFDIFIHCGDFTNFGCIKEAYFFNQFLKRLNCRHKIIVPGNPEFFPDLLVNIITNAIFLLDQTIVIEGLKIHGSRFKPIQNILGMSDIRAKIDFSDIPKDLDILITHQPCHGYRRNDHLYQKILEVEPRYHFFGHVHEVVDTLTIGKNTQSIHAAMKDEKHKRLRRPIIIEIPDRN